MLRVPYMSSALIWKGRLRTKSALFTSGGNLWFRARAAAAAISGAGSGACDAYVPTRCSGPQAARTVADRDRLAPAA